MEIYFGDANKISKTIRFDSRYATDGNLLRRASAVEWAASAWRANRARPSGDGNGRAVWRANEALPGGLARRSFRARVRRVARCVLFVAPGGRAIVRAAVLLSPREVCVSRDCWPVGHLAPSTYVVTHAKRASLRGLRSARALAPAYRRAYRLIDTNARVCAGCRSWWRARRRSPVFVNNKIREEFYSPSASSLPRFLSLSFNSIPSGLCACVLCERNAVFRMRINRERLHSTRVCGEVASSRTSCAFVPDSFMIVRLETRR